MVMPAMPPLQLSASSSATATATGGHGAFGGTSSAIQQGDWNVSNGGRGAVGSSAINPVYLAAGAVAVWLFLRRR